MNEWIVIKELALALWTVVSGFAVTYPWFTAILAIIPGFLLLQFGFLICMVIEEREWRRREREGWIKGMVPGRSE